MSAGQSQILPELGVGLARPIRIPWFWCSTPKPGPCWCVTNGRPPGMTGFDELELAEFLRDRRRPDRADQQPVSGGGRRLI